MFQEQVVERIVKNVGLNYKRTGCERVIDRFTLPILSSMRFEVPLALPISFNGDFNDQRNNSMAKSLGPLNCFGSMV